MALSIREALNFGGLFGASVVAGENGIDTPIESVTVLEVAESNISRWVLKNQLYITSFYAIYDDVVKQKIVIETLINCGACGLVLCYVGTWIQQIDDTIIQLCNDAGFPLIQARTDVSYIEIMNPIINLLHEEDIQADNSKDGSIIREDLLNLIVNEENMEVVFKKMNQRLEKKISYFDTYGKTIFSDKNEEIVRSEEDYLCKSFNHVLFACSKRGYTIEKINGRESLIALIRSQRNLFGLFITDYDMDFSYDKEGRLIDSLVFSGALIMRKRNRSADFREKAIEEYVTDLLVWNFPSKEKAIERSQELDISILDKNRIVIININSIQRMVNPKVQEEMQNYIKRVVLEQIDYYIKRYNSQNWLVFRSDTIILFLNQQNKEIEMKKFCEGLMKIFNNKQKLSISIGVGNKFSQVTELPTAYKQAFHAAVIGREHYGDDKIIFYDSVYFFQLLKQMRDLDEPKEICRRLLRPVLRYDKEHGTNLMETLRCLLNNNGNTLLASQEMYVHKNTILQRKAKIIELLEYSPFEMPHLLNMLIVFDVLKDN